MEDRILQAFQEWPFTSGGRFAFRARSEFRYVDEESRWQMTWMTTGSWSLFTGGLEEGGEVAFYEYQPTGNRRRLTLQPGMRYVLYNITENSFVVEERRSADDGESYNIVKWRLLYRRRVE